MTRSWDGEKRSGATVGWLYRVYIDVIVNNRHGRCQWGSDYQGARYLPISESILRSATAIVSLSVRRQVACNLTSAKTTALGKLQRIRDCQTSQRLFEITQDVDIVRDSTDRSMHKKFRSHMHSGQYDDHTLPHFRRQCSLIDCQEFHLLF